MKINSASTEILTTRGSFSIDFLRYFESTEGGNQKKKTIALFAALLLVATLSLTVAGCQDRAFVPKEKTKPAAETTNAPAQSPTAPTTK